MIISIASGKGGTGKTTVATNLAVSLAARGLEPHLFDCDVEEPNAHLFINPYIDQTTTAYTLIPEINADKCTYCKKCMQICRFKAITVVGKTVLTFPELCHSCGGCAVVCPEKAVTEIGRELGVVKQGYSGKVKFVDGRLRVGEAMSPPLIKKVRSHIKPENLNIIDAPPGTSCPVITAVKDTDFVLMVTEPTPFGLHDLRLGVQAVKLLKINMGLVINRSDIGNQEVRDYARQENIPILLEIPFDRKIAEAYSRGKMIVDAMPLWKDKFVELYHQIEEIVKRKKS